MSERQFATGYVNMGQKSVRNPNGWIVTSKARSYMRQRYDMSFLMLKDVLNEIIDSSDKDFVMLERLCIASIPHIPKRSGHLINSIFTSFMVSHFTWYGSNHFITISFKIPANRPLIVLNPMHTPPEEGYGEWGTVITTNPYLMLHIQENVIRVTAGGNALYMLNDPTAKEDYSEAIKREIQTVVEEHVWKVFEDLLVIYNLRLE